ncbi:hypothetical protein GCM10028813_52080 [Ramlibacter alkalitolerans]|jgi:hypothetical protein
MKHIPFAALPVADRQALAEALRRSGVPLRHVCISCTEPTSADEAQGVATVTGAGWIRSYAAEAGWIGQLEHDLLALRPAAPAQSGLPDKQGDTE